MVSYNTNLASEYWVLSMLYRKGFDAFITLGNKKSVDIIVTNIEGNNITIDVKGIKSKTLFPIDNFDFEASKNNHFLIFVSFIDEIRNHNISPEVYIVPSSKIKSLVYRNPKGTRVGVTLSTLRKEKEKYKDAWELLYCLGDNNFVPESIDELEWLTFLKAYNSIRSGYYNIRDIEEIFRMRYFIFLHIQTKNKDRFKLDCAKVVEDRYAFRSLYEITKNFEMIKDDIEFSEYIVEYERLINSRIEKGETIPDKSEFIIKDWRTYSSKNHPNFLKLLSDESELNIAEKQDRKERFKS